MREDLIARRLVSTNDVHQAAGLANESELRGVPFVRAAQAGSIDKL